MFFPFRGEGRNYTSFHTHLYIFFFIFSAIFAARFKNSLSDDDRI